MSNAQKSRRPLVPLGAALALTLGTLGAVLPLAPALAWGPNGHAIVADIAEDKLTPATSAAVHALLASGGYQSLDQIASWPDTIGHLPADKGGEPDSLPWHYVDIPLKADAYDPQRDCPHDACVLAKIPEFAHILADRTQDQAVRLRALKFLVHFVGDIHQPLHAEDNDDKGGNLVKVTYFGYAGGPRGLNLHSVWDESIIDHELSLVVAPDYSIDFAKARAAAGPLETAITPAETAAWTPADIGGAVASHSLEWALESHSLAATVAYAKLPAGNPAPLADAYEAEAWPVVRTRLEQAGVRLGALLNALLP